MAEELYSITQAAEAFEIPVSTLRYYDDIGLVTAPTRRARVRYYDRAALTRLAYTRLWRSDAMLGVDDTASITQCSDKAERNKLLARCRDQIIDRIDRLNEALETIDHMMQCRQDDPLSCRVGSARLRRDVDVALSRLETSR